MQLTHDRQRRGSDMAVRSGILHRQIALTLARRIRAAFPTIADDELPA